MLRRSLLLLVPLLLLTVLHGAPPTAWGDSGPWIRRLTSNDADEIFSVIRDAAAKADPAASEPLVEFAKSTEWPHLAVASGEALRAIGWPGEDAEQRGEAIDFVEKTMRTRSGLEMRNLARVFGAWGDPLLDEHLAHLCSGRRDPETQAEALMMAGSVPLTAQQDFPETREEIVKALEKGRSEAVRVAACSAAARWSFGSSGSTGSTSFIEPLITMVRRDRDEYPGLFAVWALRQLGYAGGIDPFLHVLKSNPKKTTRQACLKAVTELATLADVESLLGLTKSGKKDYRDAAALALGRIAWRGGFRKGVVTGDTPEDVDQDVPEDVINRLIDLVHEDKDWEVRDAARQSLLRIGKPAGDLIRKRMPNAIDFSEDDTSLTAMELCGLFEAADAYRPLWKIALFEKDPTKRMFAARALEGVGPATAVTDLGEVIDRIGDSSRDDDLRPVTALGYIRTRPSFDRLVGLLASGTNNEKVLREVEFSLERLTGHRFGRDPDKWNKWVDTVEDPFHPLVEKFDARASHRKEAASQGLYGLSGNTERAVERGLRWLSLQQHDIGFWDGNEKGFGGVVGCEPAYTGLSLLAFLGAGYNARDGKFREVIRRATEFLTATQFYDGGYPVTGGGDSSWIFAYLIAMGIWGITESYGLSQDDTLREPAQWGIDYLVRVQTPGAGWRYGPRYVQSDTSCTSWVLMAMKAGDLVGLDVAQRSYDGIDSWLTRCSVDMTGKEEVIEDLSTDYDYEVGSRQYYKAFTSYFEVNEGNDTGSQKNSMTPVGMVCRFFMGWKRSHPYMIGCANYLMDYLPVWMKGLEGKGQSVAWYHYFWYYGTLAMHQMGGRYWRAWNDKIRRMYPEKQRTSPPELIGSWDPDTAVLNGGRLFSTAMSILSLETYYRFSPLLNAGDAAEDD